MTIIDEACYERGCACHDSREGSGIEVFAGDGGYGIGTREAYEEFVKLRNYPIPPKQNKPVGVVALVDGKKIGIIYDYSVNIDDDLYTTPQPKQELGEPSCPECVFGACHCKQDKVFVEGYGENSHSFVSITKHEPDYKALWEQMCERCDWLDKELAAYTEQEQGEPVTMQMDVIVVNLVREGINKHRARELAEHFIKHTTPQQRTTEPERQLPQAERAAWVGLTDEEMLECNMDGDLMIGRETAKRNVEAKLKEKNT